METTVIIVPSQEDRNRSAQAAIDRHDALDPIPLPPAFFACCNQPPQYRKGGAMLTSVVCPVCKARYGMWTLNDSLVRNGWNYLARQKQAAMIEIDGFKLVESIYLTVGREDLNYREILVKKEPGKIIFRHPDSTETVTLDNLTSGIYISTTIVGKYVTEQLPITADTLPSTINGIFLHGRSSKWEVMIDKLVSYIDEASNGH